MSLANTTIVNQNSIASSPSNKTCMAFHLSNGNRISSVQLPPLLLSTGRTFDLFFERLPFLAFASPV
jgi:hypothetical protein